MNNNNNNNNDTISEYCKTFNYITFEDFKTKITPNNIDTSNKIQHLPSQNSQEFVTVSHGLEESPNIFTSSAGGYRKTLHKSKKSRKSKKTKKSSKKTSKKH